MRSSVCELGLLLFSAITLYPVYPGGILGNALMFVTPALTANVWLVGVAILLGNVAGRL